MKIFFTLTNRVDLDEIWSGSSLFVKYSFRGFWKTKGFYIATDKQKSLV